MPKITYIQPDGRSDTVEVSNGTSIMQASVTNDLPGIIGECGGSAMCATCHCYINETFLDRLPAMSAVEDEMLDATMAERRPNSRLGCQVELDATLDGIVVQLPDRQ